MTRHCLNTTTQWQIISSWLLIHLQFIYIWYTFVCTLLDCKHFDSSHPCFLHSWSSTWTARKTGPRNTCVWFTEIIYASHNLCLYVSLFCPPSIQTSGGWESCHWHVPSRHTQVLGMTFHRFFQTSMEMEHRSQSHPSGAWPQVGSRMHCDETRTSQSHDPDHHNQAQDTCNTIMYTC